MKNLELIEKSLKKNSTQQLVSKLEKLNENSQEFEIILSIVEKRGQDVSKWRKEEQKEVVVYQSKEELTPEEAEIIDKHESKELSEKERLIEEVDKFMDELIAQKRTGVNLEVLKALGGQYGSDLDELLENASIEQLKDALSFKNLKQDKTEVKNEKKDVIKKVKENNKKQIESKNIESFNVEFTVALNSKKAPGEILTGKVVLDFICPIVKKQFFKIKTEKGLFIKKADACKKI